MSITDVCFYILFLNLRNIKINKHLAITKFVDTYYKYVQIDSAKEYMQQF